MNPWMGQVASGNPDRGSHQISLFNLNPLLQKNQDNQKFWQSKLCFKNTIVWIAIAPQKVLFVKKVNRRTFFSESRVNELMVITKLQFMQKKSRVDFKYLPLHWSAAFYILSCLPPRQPQRFWCAKMMQEYETILKAIHINHCQQL